MEEVAEGINLLRFCGNCKQKIFPQKNSGQPNIALTFSSAEGREVGPRGMRSTCHLGITKKLYHLEALANPPQVRVGNLPLILIALNDTTHQSPTLVPFVIFQHCRRY